jgi:hypothetical protein
MRLLLKSLLHRRFAYDELRQDADHFFVRPPLPPDLRDSLAKLRGKSGDSLLDFWRRLFDEDVRMVCEAPTWQAQRAALLRAILRETTWRALWVAAKECRHTQSWAHLVENDPIIGKSEEAVRDGQLFQRYLLAVTTIACLTSIGRTRYGIDEQKVTETEVFYLFDLEIKRLDISILDYAMDLADALDDETAHAIADFKDEEVNPIIHQQIESLSLAQEQIVQGRLDVQALRASVAEVGRRKSELVARLHGRARAAPNDQY